MHFCPCENLDIWSAAIGYFSAVLMLELYMLYNVVKQNFFKKEER